MKATLTFTLPEEQPDFTLATKGSAYYGALWDIAQDVFRPHRKHGYPNPLVQTLLETSGDAGTDLVEQLEKMFYEILQQHSINLDEIP